MLVFGTPLKEGLQSRSQAFQIQENENSIKQLNRNLKSNRGKEGAKSDLVSCFHKTHTFDMPLKVIRKPLLDSTSHNPPVYLACSSAVDSATSKTLRGRPVLSLPKISWVLQMSTMTWIYYSRKVRSTELTLSVNTSHIVIKSVGALLDMRVLILRV